VLALSLGNLPIPSDLPPALNIKPKRFEEFKASKLLIRMDADESATMESEIFNPIIGALLEQSASPSEIVKAHALLANYIQNDISDMARRLSTVPIDFSLVGHVDGEPLAPEGI